MFFMKNNKAYETKKNKNNVISSLLNKIDKRVLCVVVLIVVLIILISSSSIISTQGINLSLDSSTTSTYTITIEYLSEDSEMLFSSYVANVPAGKTFTQSVTSPTYLGYTPYYEGTDDDAIVVEVNVEEIDEDVTIRVIYKPDETTYIVRRYLQNTYDENYTLYSTEVKTGTVDTEIDYEDIEEEIEGFTQQIYDTQVIEADGSTVVNVYYDRNYYLISFDLQGGYGVSPIYAQYGTSISVTDTPTKAGYTFIGWDLDGDGVSDDIVRTMPAENLKYTAMYEATTTTYTVIYWLEDANEDGEYNYWGSEQLTATSDTTVDGSDRAETLGLTDYVYATYEKADTDVTVEGDGSTIVNVYYTRNEYTLRFFYAKESNGSYYVVGGSTYGFGTSGTSDTDTLQDLLENVTSSQWGEVETLPEVSGDDEDKYTYGSETYDDVIYYYIAFTAKYGENIMDIWPAYVFEPVEISSAHSQTNLMYAYFSAWNGERKVYYSQNNSNQTIKGKIEILDYVVLYDLSQYEDSDVVNYLAFWENGATGISWSVPVEWTYNIYVENSDGEYELKYSYIVYDNNTTISSQTAPSLEGYTLVSSEAVSNGTVTYEDTETLSAYIANFYYTLNSYTVTMQNVSTQTNMGTYNYGTSLEELNVEPDYPSEYEEGVYYFVGWYTTVDCIDGTEFDFENDTMPANNLILYAKWEKITHTVTLYEDYDDYDNEINAIATIEVVHGEVVGDDYDDITRTGYTFVGWFYIDDSGKQIFGLSSMQVTEDISLYAEWEGTTIVSYKVSYIYVQEDGTEVDVAEPTTGYIYQGVTKVFSAKTDGDLYEEFQEGYFPSVLTYVMNVIYMNSETNEYVFYYTYQGSMEYTVEYRDATTGELMSTDLFLDSDNNPDKENPKVVSTTVSVTTETFVPIEGYLPTAYQQTLILQDDSSENVIVFYYTEDTSNGIYLVSHYLELTDGSWHEVLTEEGIATLNSTLSVDAEEFTAYTFNEDISTTTGTITEYGLHLQLYYNLNEYEYTVQYLLYGTDEELADTITSTAKYSSTLTWIANEIEGYELISSDTKSIVINMSDNTITFYYIEEEAKVSLTITKVSSGDTNKVIEGAVFELYELVCLDSSHEHDTDDDLIDPDNYDESCWNLVGTYTSDEMGEFTLSELSPASTYRLVETQTASALYFLPDGQWKIELNHYGNLSYDEDAFDYGDTRIKITAIGNPPALSYINDMLYLYNVEYYDIPTTGDSGIENLDKIGVTVVVAGVCWVTWLKSKGYSLVGKSIHIKRINKIEGKNIKRISKLKNVKKKK